MWNSELKHFCNLFWPSGTIRCSEDRSRITDHVYSITKWYINHTHLYRDIGKIKVNVCHFHSNNVTSSCNIKLQTYNFCKMAHKDYVYINGAILKWNCLRWVEFTLPRVVFDVQSGDYNIHFRLHLMDIWSQFRFKYFTALTKTQAKIVALDKNRCCNGRFASLTLHSFTYINP